MWIFALHTTDYRIKVRESQSHSLSQMSLAQCDFSLHMYQVTSLFFCFGFMLNKILKRKENSHYQKKIHRWYSVFWGNIRNPVDEISPFSIKIISLPNILYVLRKLILFQFDTYVFFKRKSFILKKKKAFVWNIQHMLSTVIETKNLLILSGKLPTLNSVYFM